MSWASLVGPRVVMTRPWVSPRWKIALPWTRGRTPTSQEIGRRLLASRPSERTPRSSTVLR